MAVPLKYDIAKKKKQAELKRFEIFRRYFLQVINVGDNIVRPILHEPNH